MKEWELRVSQEELHLSPAASPISSARLGRSTTSARAFSPSSSTLLCSVSISTENRSGWWMMLAPPERMLNRIAAKSRWSCTRP